jgi:hypothetical protein
LILLLYINEKPIHKAKQKRSPFTLTHKWIQYLKNRLYNFLSPAVVRQGEGADGIIPAIGGICG